MFLEAVNINLFEITYFKSQSKYKGVTWNTKNKSWRAAVHWESVKYDGGYYYDELDAAKKVNALCDNLGIERNIPEVDAMEIPKVMKKLCVDHVPTKTFFVYLKFFITLKISFDLFGFNFAATTNLEKIF